MTTAKPIFAYIGTLTPEAVQSLTDAGYVAVQVESMDSVRIIDPVPLASLDPVCRAAFDCIASAGPTSTVPELFGRRVARALGSKDNA